MGKFLTRDEERELVLRAKDGDTEARNKVVMDSSLLVRKIANRLANGNQQAAEIYYAESMAHILKQFPIFDIERGFRFTAWAGKLAWQAIMLFKEKDKIIPARFVKKNRLTPMTANRYARTRSVASLDEVMPGEKQSLAGNIADKRSSQSDHYSTAEYRAKEITFVRKVWGKMHPRDAKVLKLRTMGYSLGQIAKYFGVTKERVRQIESRAMRDFIKWGEVYKNELPRTDDA